MFQDVRRPFRWAFGGIIVLGVALCFVPEWGDVPWFFDAIPVAMLLFALALFRPALRWPMPVSMAMILIIMNFAVFDDRRGLEWALAHGPVGKVLLADAGALMMLVISLLVRRRPQLFMRTMREEDEKHEDSH